jgi:hypothetical protein
MRFLFSISLLLLQLCTIAQKNTEPLSAGKHISLAKKLVKTGGLGEAADHYFEAYKLKPKKFKYIDKAGELFAASKDYYKASESYKFLKDKIKDFPMARYQYATALMNNGSYDDANREFVYFIETYKGKDAEAITLKAQQQKRNCDFGLKLMNNYQKDVIIDHLPAAINSPNYEFAPIPFSDNILYFSSTMKGGIAKMFRTQLLDNEWTNVELATGFNMKKDVHFGNGAFTPDLSRFYYTQCEGVEEKGKIVSRCKIFMMKQMKGHWSQPTPLHPYINAENSTTTQPYIAHVNDKEVLYFVSDREGGKGGMDIWYAIRDIKSDDIDFSAPVNAGSINTEANDITPFYDTEEEEIYYSSNGMMTAGGYDIYKSAGKLNKWSKPLNLGMPLNSGADDYYYVLNKSKNAGFLVSNRTFGVEKLTTRDEDIFKFNIAEKELYAAGKIFDDEDKTLAKGTRIALYQLADNDTKKLLESKITEDGSYKFSIIKEKNYRIEVDKDGFYSTFFELTSNQKDKLDYGRSLYLKKLTVTTPAPKSDPIVTISEVKKSDKDKFVYNEKATKVSSGTNNTKAKNVFNNAINGKYGDFLVSKGEVRNVKSSSQKETLVTTAPVKEGTYYKIQVLAYQKMNDFNSRKLAQLISYGRIDTEYFEEKNVNRALVSDFTSYEEAQAKLPAIRKEGFSDAYIIKYKDGIRIGAFR